MTPARRRRRLPTLIDRGLGLLEVILPGGSGDDRLSTLPEGQRDSGGFWFPPGYGRPGDIFTPEQRKLQAKQRQVQRQRIRSREDVPPIVSGSEGTAAADTAPSRPHAPPAARPAAPARPAGTLFEGAVLADRTLPLPPPFLEAAEAGVIRLSISPAASVLPTGRAGGTILSEPAGMSAAALCPVVDSHKGSD